MCSRPASSASVPVPDARAGRAAGLPSHLTSRRGLVYRAGSASRGTGLTMQRRTAVRLLAAAAVTSSLVIAAVAFGATLSLRASMTPTQVITPSGKQWRVPPSVRSARGTFTGKLLADGRTLTWRITYAKVSGRVIADIHIGRPGKFGGVLGRLCTACRSGQTGRLKLKRNYATQFRVNNTWVTLITPKYPNGVIRGQITKR